MTTEVQTDLLDILCLGTSPLMMIEGLRQVRAGRSVAFVDDGELAGGSWRTRPGLGFDRVEPGVHLIENRPPVNALLVRLLGERILESPAGENFGLVAGRRLGAGPTRVLLHGLVAAKAALRADLEKARLIGRSAALSLRSWGAPFLYPEGGAAELIDALKSRLEQEGARFYMGARVERIRERRDHIEAVAGSRTIGARRLTLSSRAHALVEGSPDLSFESAVVHCLTLRVAAPSVAFNGYVEVLGDALLKRVRNVTSFTRPAPPAGEAVISVQIRRAGDRTDEQLAEATLRRLIDLGLLPDGVRPLDFMRTDTRLDTMRDADLMELAARHARIEALRSTDLADGLMRRLAAAPDLLHVT